MGEVGDAYAGCRARIAALTGDLDGAAGATPVPTCPDWTVHDVVAHVAGVVDDVLGGRVDGVATDPWTAAQVDARREVPVADILATWQAQAPAFEAVLDDFGMSGRQAVLDVFTHEHDIRTALGRPGARDADAMEIGLGFLLPRFVAAAAEAGVAVQVQVKGAGTHGPEDAAARLSASPFELMRALTGRRSLDQVRAMAWKGNPEPVLGTLTYGPFRPAPQAIVE
jgi:uncharacterized protein (TIGR03083 family)